MKAQRIIAFYPELVDILGSINAAIFYQQLYYWSDKGSREDGFIYKSKEEIQEETKLTREQQDLVRKRLIELGWLEVSIIKVHGAPTIHYKCLKDIGIAISGKPTNGLVGNPLIDKCETHFSSIQKITQETTTPQQASLSESENLNTNTIPTPRQKERDGKVEAFAEFWDAYPKKVAKVTAQRAWVRHVKPEEYPQVFLALKRHKGSEQWTKNNGQFIPMASTWINQRRWEDEITSNERSEILL